ncbi:MAG: fatty acid--CoA ligase family protein, partial [Acidimicrobiia bacterium]|nr:fatty acid--CoA ligase family protein [Acidimicrobiia bacterium]
IEAIRPTVLVRLGADGSVDRRRLADGSPVAEGDALVIATSGTSGTPKAVIHTHTSIEASARATSAALAVDPGSDRWLACLPLAHIGGLSVVLRALVTDTPVTVHPTFDATAVIEAATTGGVTLVSLVTRALNQVPAELFRAVLIGGAAPPGDLPSNVIPTYGMTETGSGVIYGRRILDGCEIMLADDRGDRIDRPGATGAIHVRGPMLFRGYRNGPSPFVDGGWFPTGDLGRWRADGSLEVEGRAADVIVSGGEKVWPGPIEALLAERHDVAEAAIVGRPDPEWGHRVVAIVVPTDPASPPTLDDLRGEVTDRLPAWCAPKELVVRTEPLPRTALGKLRRRALDGNPGDDQPASASRASS